MSSGTDIAFITLGCAKNEVDSDKMKARLLAAGYDIVDDFKDADLTIVNTCSFLAAAVEEGIDTIFEVLGLPVDEGLEPAKVLVAGCMPARYGSDLEEELSEVAGFLPADEEANVVEKVNQILGLQMSGGSPQQRAFTGPSAYVKISDGCDRFCSYCMIPYIRGRYHSFAEADIFAEVDELVASGVGEIVFIGQDTGIWGKDLDEPSSLESLLAHASQRFPQTWFRVMYIQPEGITDGLLSVMNKADNVCSYIDIPLQHVNGEVLKRMNRRGDHQQLLELIQHVRQQVPDVMIRTTLMCGFPGETEEQFQELLAFVDEAQFDYAGVFAYSQEEGSEAATFEDQVPEDVRLERAQKVLDACDANGFNRTKRHIGSRVCVMVEGFEQTDVGLEALGRWKGQAPEVDGQVHIPMELPDQLKIGDLVEVELVETFCYELVGEICD